MFVIIVSSILSFGANLLLVRFHAEYLRIIIYIVIIAATVQLTEMFIKKTSPALFRAMGVYLPLITTNCAVLAVPLFQTARNYSLVQSTVFAVAASGGYSHRDGDFIPGARTRGVVRCPQPRERNGSDSGAGRDSLHGVHGICGHGERRVAECSAC